MSTVQTKAEHIDIEADAYHEHPANGASMVEEFHDSRRIYHGRYVTGDLPKKIPTDTMKLGTLFHMALLEPERFAETVVTMPNLYQGEEWNWRKPSHREARDAMQAKFTAQGKECIELGDYETISEMAKAVRANHYAHKLVTNTGLPEYSIFWTDEETGLDLKCRVDWWSMMQIDIKTTNDPSPEAFAKTATALGYFRKAAHYAAGIEALSGRPAEVVMIAVENKPPFRVASYDLQDFDRDGVSLGKRQWRDDIKSLARCMETGDWREPWEKTIVRLSPPGYAYTQELYHIGD